MSLKTVLNPTTATLGFILFSAYLFLIGYQVGELPTNPTEKEKILYPILYSFLLSLTIPGATAVNYIINKQVEENSQKTIKQNVEDCEDKVKIITTRSLNRLTDIEKDLKVKYLDRPDIQESLIKIQELKGKIKQYVTNYDAAQVLAKLLSKKSLRRDLLEDIVLQIEEKYKIPINSELETKFSLDISRCLNWLCYSMKVLESPPLEDMKNYMTTALNDLQGRFNIYEDALKYIFVDLLESKKYLQDTCTQKNIQIDTVKRVLEHYITKLLEELKP